jgi:hypothetical protein
MAYQKANLMLVSQPIAGARQWVYTDTGSGIATVTGAGFFTDGGDKGMEVGDQLTYIDTTNTLNYGLRVSAVEDTGATQATVTGEVIIGDTA